MESPSQKIAGILSSVFAMLDLQHSACMHPVYQIIADRNPSYYNEYVAMDYG